MNGAAEEEEASTSPAASWKKEVQVSERYSKVQFEFLGSTFIDRASPASSHLLPGFTSIVHLM